jgi:hypothetical protein
MDISFAELAERVRKNILNKIVAQEFKFDISF